MASNPSLAQLNLRTNYNNPASSQTSQGIGGEGLGFGLALFVVQFSAKADPQKAGLALSLSPSVR